MRILIGSAACLLAASLLRAGQPSGLLPGSAKPAATDQQLGSSDEARGDAMAHFVEGLRLEDAGLMREALGHYLKALQGGAAVPLTDHVAEMAASYGSLDEALKLFEAAANSSSASADLLSAYTRFCVTHAAEKKELLQTAEKISEEALTRFPGHAQAYENAARLRLAQGDSARAAQIMEQALKQNRSDAHFWLDTGRVAQEVWPLADTEKRAEHLHKLNPFFERADKFARESGDEQAALRVADYYLFSDQLDRSVATCESVVKHNGSLDARKRLVRLYEALERPDDSLKALEDLVTAFPTDMEHRRLLAKVYMQKQDYPKALAQLEAALRDGGSLTDYLQVCNLLRVQQQPEQYLQFTQRAVQLYPGEPRLLYQEALAQNQNKHYDEGARIFEQTAKIAETRAPELLDDIFHFEHGISLERGGHFDEAAVQFEKSIELTPQDNPPRAAGAMNYLGYMWLERGEHMEKAEELIRKANEQVPDNAAFMDSLGWLFFKTGKVELALSQLLQAEKKLKDVEPDDAEIFDHIAQAYDKTGQRAKAEEYWKRVLDLKPPDEKLIKRAQKELAPKKSTPPSGEESSSAPKTR